MTQEIINRLKEALESIQSLTGGQLPDYARAANDIARHALSTLTNLTPSEGVGADALAAEMRTRGYWQREIVLRDDGGYEDTWRTKEGYEVLTALPSEPPSQGDVEGRARAAWQPIETAPRDGKHILACIAGTSFGRWGDEDAPAVQTVVHWWDGFPDEAGFYTSVNQLEPQRTFKATHWKPLDEPSKEDLDCHALETRCAWCDSVPTRANLDGEDLCQACCDKWVRAEGSALATKEDGRS